MTSALSPSQKPPAESVSLNKEPVFLTLRADVANRLLAMGIEEPARMIERAGGEAVEGGRGGVQLVPFGEGRLVVRHCRRGGLIGRLLGDLYLGRGRALREWRVSDAAAKGVLTPRIVALVQRRAFGPLFRADVVSVEVEDAIAGGDYLGWFPAAANREVLREKRQIIEAVAAAVRRMHDAGLYHGDLNASNLLLRRAGGKLEVHILDLDRSRMMRRVGPRRRRHELMRLNRSLMKMRLDPCPIDDEDRLHFLHAYTGGDDAVLEYPPRRMIRSCARTLGLHRWLWQLMGP